MSHTSWKIFGRFVDIGLRGWGGPVAQIAMLRRELVDDERWVEPHQFERAMAVYQALPGPEALELCVYLGNIRAGRRGGLAAGAGFMLPGLVFVLAAAWLYTLLGADDARSAGLFWGIAAATAVVVARSVVHMGRRTLRSRWLLAIASTGCVGYLCGVPFAVLLIIGGSAHALALSGRRRAMCAVALLIALMGFSGWAATQQKETSPTRPHTSAATLPSEPSHAAVIAAGARSGFLSFGGAYTVIPYLEHDAVSDGNWITYDTFRDGLAIATSLPAPLVIVAAFIGFTASGFGIALLLTALIVAPAFLFTMIGHRHLEALMHEPRLHAALDGVTSAVVGFMIATAGTIAWRAIDSIEAAVIAAVSAIMLWRVASRWSILLVMLGAGAAGMAISLI